MLRVRWILPLVIRINAFIKLKSRPKLRRIKIGNPPNRISLNIMFLLLIIFIQVVMCQKSCFLTAKKSLCIVLIRKISQVQFVIVNIRWVWVKKFIKFNLIQKELMKWLSVLMIIIYFQLGKKDSLFAMNSRINSRRIKWKYQIFLRNFYIQNKNLSDKKSFLINLKLKILMLRKKEINRLDNQRLNMID